MPRNPLTVAAQALDVALANDRAASKAKAKTRAALNAAMVRCVRAGMSRREVARLTNMSPQWVRQIPGMPASESAA